MAEIERAADFIERDPVKFSGKSLDEILHFVDSPMGTLRQPSSYPEQLPEKAFSGARAGVRPVGPYGRTSLQT